MIDAHDGKFVIRGNVDNNIGKRLACSGLNAELRLGYVRRKALWRNRPIPDIKSIFGSQRDEGKSGPIF